MTPDLMFDMALLLVAGLLVGIAAWSWWADREDDDDVG